MTKEQQQDFLIAYTVDKMTEYVVEDYQLPIASALHLVYESDTYQKLIQTENGLYAQSPSYVYELLTQERCRFRNST